MLTFIDLEERVPQDHPLRTIRRLADAALAALSAEFDRMYAEGGRPSIPPERLLKATLLISFYSVRSERAFCEELDYNLLFRWFLNMHMMEPSFDPTTFTKNRERLRKHAIGQQLFDEVLGEAHAGLAVGGAFHGGRGPERGCGSASRASSRGMGSHPRRPMMIRATRRWTSMARSARTRPTKAPRTPRRACCARAKGR